MSRMNTECQYCLYSEGFMKDCPEEKEDDVCILFLVFYYYVLQQKNPECSE